VQQVNTSSLIKGLTSFLYISFDDRTAQHNSREANLSATNRFGAGKNKFLLQRGNFAVHNGCSMAFYKLFLVSFSTTFASAGISTIASSRVATAISTSVASASATILLVAGEASPFHCLNRLSYTLHTGLAWVSSHSRRHDRHDHDLFIRL
jgi:hypothetical protein